MPMQALRNFIRMESAGGLLLLAAAVVAMIVSNSPLADIHHSVLSARTAVIIGPLAIDKTLLLWINDGLMAVFFLLVGLELKREVLEGELASRDQLVLPMVGAVGGFVLPAVIYALINRGQEFAMQGWAIPSATDIAFALGVLSLFGKRVPLSLKVFLASLAIIDDLAAIIVIAIFYTSQLSLLSLGLALAGAALLFTINLLGVTRTSIYITIGVFIWIAVLKSGVHATLAGVVVAMAIPLRAGEGEPSPLRTLEHSLHPWISFAILPLFAYANAGVTLSTVSSEILFSSVSIGIAAGLFFGKQIGVLLPIWLAMRAGWVKMPEGANWGLLYGVALTTGIGFTMSFFIGTLAFEYVDPQYTDAMKLGVLGGSSLSLILACVVLFFATRSPDVSQTTASQPAHSDRPA